MKLFMEAVVRATSLLSLLFLICTAEAGERWSWQEPQAKVLPTGDLEWTPHAFEFKPGESIRYIDFENGNDANDGTSKQTCWKHHPWDPNSTGQAKACNGTHSYVFKQGVVYRGELNANESGTQAAPIIVTRDPSWGNGPAVICGSEVVTSWKQGAANRLIPEPEKVWYVDLDWAPRNVWMVSEASAVFNNPQSAARRSAAETAAIRIRLARTPNWNITDPEDIKREWFTWKNPDKPFDNYTTINGQRRHLAFDPVQINTNKPQDYYEGAIVWTTKGWVMGNPFPARVLAVDREKGSLAFAGQWGGEPAYKIIRGCQYYLEDKPQYLDSPGEFWFDRKDNGGRLYLRLPRDQDPNTAQIEVAKRIHFIDSRGMSHVHVRGLTFRFANVYWNIVAAPYWVSHESLDVQPGCVRLLGSGTDIEVSHCTFEHVHKGVRLKAMGREDAIDKVVVQDNVFSDLDSGGVELADSTTYGDVAPPMGRLYDLRVLRNKFDHIGLRPDLFSQGTALEIEYAETAEVAGNFFEGISAQGIDVHGAKASGAATDRPFTRLLIHHNKAVDTLINVDDFGGIETWQGGPAYVYDNISGNPGGYRSWDHELNPNSENRFGHAYYLDGAFKNYYFNNIAWGSSKGPTGKLANTAAFQEIISYQNTFFNNTVFNFVTGSRRQEPQAGRVKFLGNIWQGIGLRVFRDADPARTAQAGEEAHAKRPRNDYAIDTDAYARNVFYDMGESFGVFEPSGRWLQTLEKFHDALQGYRPLAAEVGTAAEQPPLRNAAAHDFRPSTGSAVRGLGAKVFVPWSLYETVAEWNFYPIPGDPTRVLDEHWCMSPYYTGRDDYYKLPTYPLAGVNITLRDYQDGPLENWTRGALRFNGNNQYAVLRNEDICHPVALEARGRNETVKRTVTGPELSNPQIHTSNFLIEIFFKTAAGRKDMVLIQKINGSGYVLAVNAEGGVTLAATSDSATAKLSSRTKVNDGQWHHVIAEADRKAKTFTIYLDGKQDAANPGLGADASLANEADLYVGGARNGQYLDGAIDFLRIARGTLADSRTTIEEFYAWEFNGPFLEDFAGHRRPADGGCAGAIDEDRSADSFSLWQRGAFRGANVMQAQCTVEDLGVLRSWGANLAEIPVSNVYAPAPPYAFQPENLSKLDREVEAAEQAHLYAALTCREGPGRADFNHSQEIWRDPVAQEAYAKMWREIAMHYRGRASIVGYDIMCEPHPDQETKQPLGDWNALAKKVSTAIREVDHQTPILINSIGWAYPKQFEVLQPTGDPRTVYTVHFYDPHYYTHQKPADKINYPGFRVPGKQEVAWDKAVLEAQLAPVRAFQEKYHVPIFVGEFGCARYATGVESWMHDQIDLYEQYGWSWAYWAFREWDVMNIERSADATDKSNHPDTPLLRLFKTYFEKDKEFFTGK